MLVFWKSPRTIIPMLPIAMRFDHVSLAVRTMAAAMPLYRDLLGGRYVQSGENNQAGRHFRWLEMQMPGGAMLELIEPAGPDSFLHAFLDKRGEGVHHFTFQVDSLRQALDELRGHGYEPVQVDASNPHWREAFIHPKQGHGVLIQLFESDLSLEQQEALQQTDWGRALAFG